MIPEGPAFVLNIYIVCLQQSNVDTVRIVYCAFTLLYKGICSPLT